MIPQPSAGPRWWAVPRLWPGSTIVCVGTGPSLTAEDLDILRYQVLVDQAATVTPRVIAVNDAYTVLPAADVLYACDEQWWDRHFTAVMVNHARYRAPGLLVTMSGEASRRYGLHCLRDTGPHGIELAPTGLRNGRNSGYQVVNLAVHLGACRVLLLGYDCKPTGGMHHFFGKHWHRRVPRFREFLDHWPSIVSPLAAAGVEVINCTRSTALTCFPRMTLEEALRV